MKPFNSMCSGPNATPNHVALSDRRDAPVAPTEAKVNLNPMGILGSNRVETYVQPDTERREAQPEDHRKGLVLNSLGLTNPNWEPGYVQPGTPTALSSNDAGAATMLCPFNPADGPAHRIGSQSYPWICPKGHQYGFSTVNNQPTLLTGLSEVGIAEGVTTESP
jgi:hypothetical protein